MFWYICRRGIADFRENVTPFCICTTDRTSSMRQLRLPAWNGASTRRPNASSALDLPSVNGDFTERAELRIRTRIIEPVIVVAVANMGEDRVDEYTPTPGVIGTKARRKKRSRGLARLYGYFLMEELKPYIDRKYRTKPDAEFTGLGGSSLGGLVTLA